MIMWSAFSLKTTSGEESKQIMYFGTESGHNDVICALWAFSWRVLEGGSASVWRKGGYLESKVNKFLGVLNF